MNSSYFLNNASRRDSRFARHMPLLSALTLNPVLSVFCLLTFAGMLSLLSVHYSLSLLIVLMAVVSYYLERNLLERVLLPPFSIIAFWEGMGSGIGVSLLTLGNYGEFSPGLFKIQCASLLTIPVGWCFYRIAFGRIRTMHFPEMHRDFDRDVVRPLAWVGWFFLLFQVIRILVMASTGNLDRGELAAGAGGELAGRTNFGFWTVFNLFPRLNFCGFFLVPVVWRMSNSIGRSVMLVFLGVYFLVVLVSGSRGILIYPILFIIIGIYFFRPLKTVKIDLVVCIFAIVAMPFIVIIDAYRNTDAYRSTRTMDISGRLAAFDDAIERIKGDRNNSKGRQNYTTLGASLLGRSDYMIYEIVDAGAPKAGFERFRAILYTFTPTFFARNKPVLIDSNLIYWNYLGVVDGTGRGMSLAADAYRRFGWIGIPAVTAIFFSIYGFICGRFYKIYYRKNALLGILLILLSFSFFHIQPFSSVLESWWQLSYSLVKHVLALVLGSWSLRALLKLAQRRGLDSY